MWIYACIDAHRLSRTPGYVWQSHFDRETELQRASSGKVGCDWAIGGGREGNVIGRRQGIASE